MMISFKCRFCGNTLHEDHRAAGKLRQCPKCLRAVKVPKREVKRSRWYGILLALAALVAIAGVAWAVSVFRKNL